jgi:pimeloyl-ACP methyl ester carboxylesterase
MSNLASAAAVSIVLVHGGFVDGSGWRGIYNILKHDGYSVSIVQNPTITLAGDVAATKQVIEAQTGPVVLVGHSYGGAAITEAGNDPKVAGLVYVTAFAPDKGESVGSLIANPAPGAPVPPIVPAGDGMLLLDKAKFAAAFAADVAPDEHMIPPDAQRMMARRAGATVVEANGSHAVYVSDPKSVAAIIESAAKAVGSATR